MNRQQITNHAQSLRETLVSLEKVDNGCRGCTKFIYGHTCVVHGLVPAYYVEQGCDEWEHGNAQPDNLSAQITIDAGSAADDRNDALKALAAAYPALFSGDTIRCQTLAMDVECFPNWLYVAFRNVATDEVVGFELRGGMPLDIVMIRLILQSCQILTFNGTRYDSVVISMALTGADCAAIHAMSKALIASDRPHWEVARVFGISIIEMNHVDLFHVAPGRGSLKLYGGRLHCSTLCDLPVDPDTNVSPEQIKILKTYCANDLDLTVALYYKLAPQNKLRETMTEKYGIDLRSKSEPQIAEAVIARGVEQLSGKKLKRPIAKAVVTFKYQPPDFIQFTMPSLNQVLGMVREVEFLIDNSGAVQPPESLKKLTVQIGNSSYRLGLGGLHSTEASVAHYTDSDYVLIDRDVSSFYPSIIRKCALAPASMGNHFLTVFGDLLDQRLDAKRQNNKIVADALKLAINGVFGKLGSVWSSLYAPDLLIQVTLTGQLLLLGLIETLENSNISVISANTDGIVIKCPRVKIALMESIIRNWEETTGFSTDATEYSAIFERDVNNYISILASGEIKTKGTYAVDGGLSKNPANLVCTEAVISHLIHGTSVETTILNCKDITRFITLRTVKEGAVKDDEYVGRVIRWYYSCTEVSAIHHKISGNKVPKSDGAKPLMTLPDEFPSDVNYARYIAEANRILSKIGALAPKHAQAELTFS